MKRESRMRGRLRKVRINTKYKTARHAYITKIGSMMVLTGPVDKRFCDIRMESSELMESIRILA